MWRKNNLGIYTYFVLGIVLGLAIGAYYMADREEKIQKEIAMQQRIFSTKKLDKALDKAVGIMKSRIDTLNRELTEEEKDRIIYDCYVTNDK
jgi:Flp pilus assembly protein TadB